MTGTRKHTGNATVRGKGLVLLKPGDVIIPQKLKESLVRRRVWFWEGLGHPGTRRAEPLWLRRILRLREHVSRP